MSGNYTGKVGHGTVNSLLRYYDWKLCLTYVILENVYLKSSKSFSPMLVATLQLYGGLNHTIFRPLFLLWLRSLFPVSGWNLILWTNLLLERALLNNFLELLNTVLSDDNLFIRQEMLSGRFFIMLGGWLEFTFMYNDLASGLLYGLYLPVDRFSVKSR